MVACESHARLEGPKYCQTRVHERVDTVTMNHTTNVGYSQTFAQGNAQY